MEESHGAVASAGADGIIVTLVIIAAATGDGVQANAAVIRDDVAMKAGGTSRS